MEVKQPVVIGGMVVYRLAWIENGKPIKLEIIDTRILDNRQKEQKKWMQSRIRDPVYTWCREASVTKQRILYETTDREVSRTRWATNRPHR